MAALAGTIVVRIAAVSALAPAAGIAALVAAHALARSAAIAMLATQPLARDGGLGADYSSTVRRPGATAGVVCAAAFVAVATGWWIGPLAIAAVVAAVLVGWLARRKIGGITGDVLGAAEQVGECLVLLTACGLAAADPVWWSA